MQSEETDIDGRRVSEFRAFEGDKAAEVQVPMSEGLQAATSLNARSKRELQTQPTILKAKEFQITKHDRPQENLNLTGQEKLSCDVK